MKKVGIEDDNVFCPYESKIQVSSIFDGIVYVYYEKEFVGEVQVFSDNGRDYILVNNSLYYI